MPSNLRMIPSLNPKKSSNQTVAVLNLQTSNRRYDSSPYLFVCAAPSHNVGEEEGHFTSNPVVNLYCITLLFLPSLELMQKQGEWQAKGAESSTVFSNVDLSENEWYDYDEKSGAEVSIKDVAFEVKRA